MSKPNEDQGQNKNHDHDHKGVNNKDGQKHVDKKEECPPVEKPEDCDTDCVATFTPTTANGASDFANTLLIFDRRGEVAVIPEQGTSQTVKFDCDKDYRFDLTSNHTADVQGDERVRIFVDRNGNGVGDAGELYVEERDVDITFRQLQTASQDGRYDLVLAFEDGNHRGISDRDFNDLVVRLDLDCDDKEHECYNPCYNPCYNHYDVA